MQKAEIEVERTQKHKLGAGKFTFTIDYRMNLSFLVPSLETRPVNSEMNQNSNLKPEKSEDSKPD